MHDVIIVGGGIAAHTAAVYTSRAKLNVLVISATTPLDQLTMTTLVENYPGFSKGIMGPDLIIECKKQAKRFGAKYETGFVKSIEKTNFFFKVFTDNNDYSAKAVIISTGASPRKLRIPGEDKYFGKGVSTCATCDAPLFKNKSVTIIGGGDTAMEYALFLAKFTNNITIIHRKNEFRASKIMQDKVFKINNKVKIKWNSKVIEVIGKGNFVTGIKIKNVKTNKETEISCEGMFLGIGHTPNTDSFKGLVKLDKEGYIKTDNSTKTNVKGLFAAGDCQDTKYWQAITAAGTGCIAALESEKYINDL
jgi:thioredoxin reductase (NADPH)